MATTTQAVSGKVRGALRSLQEQQHQLQQLKYAATASTAELKPTHSFPFLSEQQLVEAVGEIFDGECTASQAGAFLVALNTLLTPIEGQENLRSASKRIGKIIADVALTIASRLPEEWKGGWRGGEEEGRRGTTKLLDIVGTGGDALDTFNASTAAGIVVASVTANHKEEEDGLRIRVGKQGNRSSSGRCGAGDLIEALGSRLDLTPSESRCRLEETGFVFLFAPNIHRPSALVTQTRRELGIRTIFNLIGPLLNPSQPNFMLVGVGAPQLLLPYAHALTSLPWLERAMLVHAVREGLDEISPSGETESIFLTKDDKGGWKMEEKLLTPLQDFGVEPFPIELVLGGSPSENSTLFLSLLNQQHEEESEEKKMKLRATLEFVSIQAGAGLHLSGVAKDLKSGVEMARSASLNGSASRLLESYVSLTSPSPSNQVSGGVCY